MRKKRAHFFFIFKDKRGLFFQIEGAHFFDNTLMLMHEMRKIRHGSTNRSKHQQVF